MALSKDTIEKCADCCTPNTETGLLTRLMHYWNNNDLSIIRYFVNQPYNVAAA